MNEKLKELRREMGVKQKEVADAIGVSLSAYGNYEQGITYKSFACTVELRKRNMTS